MDGGLDFILGLMTVLCTIWIVTHIYFKLKLIKKDDKISNQIETLFSGGNNKIISF